MYCAKCGKPLGDTDRFCQYCGAPTDVGENENKTPETTGMSAGEKQIDTGSMKCKETLAEGNKNMSGKTAIKITIGFFAAALVCLGVFTITSRKESGGNDYTENESIKPEETQEKAVPTEEPLIVKPLLKRARGYDEYGNLLREITYDRDGSRIECNYDQDGNLIRETSFDEEGHQTIQYTYDSTGNLIQEFELEYDGDGNTIKDRFFSTGSQDESIWEYEYDDDGKLIEMQYYRGYILSEIYEYEYDDNDFLKGIYRYYLETGNRDNTGSLELEYDSSGKLIQYRAREYSYYDTIVDFKSAASAESDVNYEIAQGTISGIREEENDREGKLVAIRDYTDGNVVYLQEYEHDSRGNCIKYSTFSYNPVEVVQKYEHGYEYEYDSNDQLSVERYYEGEGNLDYEITMEYEYYE